MERCKDVSGGYPVHLVPSAAVIFFSITAEGTR